MDLHREDQSLVARANQISIVYCRGLLGEDFGLSTRERHLWTMEMLRRECLEKIDGNLATPENYKPMFWSE